MNVTKVDVSGAQTVTNESSFASAEFAPCLLARNEPALFLTLSTDYCAITQLAVEESVLRTDRQVFARVRHLARRAGEKNAVPQDLVCVHIAGLSMIADKLPRPVAKACAQHARLLLLKMIGELALYYREQASLIRNAAE